MIMGSQPLFLTGEEQQLLCVLSRLATCNPFLRERVELEREALGDDFEEGGPVWSKQVRLNRYNPNVTKLADRAEALLKPLCERLAKGATPTQEEVTLYEDLVNYILYYRYEEEFERAMEATNLSFYDDFVRDAKELLALPALQKRSESELAHGFAFLFQIRRASHHVFDFIVGSSMPAARLRASVWESIFTHDLRRYRRCLFDKMGDVATLITGPSGTGKELVAQAIAFSRYIPFDPRQRRFALDPAQAFYPLNLSALAPTLIESELFGHRRGAFTGALQDRKGWLRVCPALGTVFLDEIGELEPAIQVKLLRVLQTREFQPLGDTRSQRFEGKIVTATHRDLSGEMRTGRFREDLYYRLCSDLVITPSLKEQIQDAPGDLQDLVLFIAKRFVGEDEAEAVSDEVLRWIETSLGESYDWPGNVRELEQCVRNVVIRKEYRPPAAIPPASPAGEQWLDAVRRGELSAEALMEHYCQWVYRQTGSYVETARRLDLDRRTVKSKVEALRKRREL